MSYMGRCACDAVRIRIDGAPISVRQCWCRHCQQLACGGPTHNAIFATDEVAVEGDLRWNAHAADSGNQLHWSFCPKCGSQLLAYSAARPHLRVVRLGAIDRPHDLRPHVAIWTREAPSWAKIDPALENHPGQPPAPAVASSPVR